MASASQGKEPIAAKLEPKVRVTGMSSTVSAKETAVRFQISNLDFFYGAKQAIFGMSLNIPVNKVTAIIGPSGCGKSTFLRTLNRMNDTIRNAHFSGDILLDGQNILEMDVVGLRRRVGMVFQRPNPFPKSIYDNVAYGLRINGYTGRLSDRVEHSLHRAALWDEVKDYLHKSAFALSGGQQQRLCIARALAVDPEVLLLDEPCSALDPVTTAKIEELMFRAGRWSYDGNRHTQHAASRARERLHGVHAGRKADRAQRNIEAFHDAFRSANGGLHHRPVWLRIEGTSNSWNATGNTISKS